MKRLFLSLLILLSSSQVSFGSNFLNDEIVDNLCTVKNIGADSYFICRDFFISDNFSLKNKTKEYQNEAQNIIRKLYNLNNPQWNSSKSNIEMAQFVVNFTRKFGFGYNCSTGEFDKSYLNNLYQILYFYNDSTKNVFQSLLNDDTVHIYNYHNAFMIDKLYQLSNFNKDEFGTAIYYLKNSKFEKAHIDSLSKNQLYKIIRMALIKENLSSQENSVLNCLFSEKIYPELAQKYYLSKQSKVLLNSVYTIITDNNSLLLEEQIKTKDVNVLNNILDLEINKNLKFNNASKDEYKLAYKILSEQKLNYPFFKSKQQIYNSTLEKMFLNDETLSKEQIKFIEKMFEINAYENLYKYDILNHINKNNYKEVCRLLKQDTIDFKAIEKQVKKVVLYNLEALQ